MRATIALAVLCCACALLLWMVVRASYHNGQLDERHDNDEEQRKTVIQAAHVRDRLLRDAVFARRVRARFTR